MASTDAVAQYAGKTDVGMRRLNNQDYFVLAPASDESEWRSRGHVFVVADGMGGQAVGELASKLAATTIVHTYRKLKHLDLVDALEEAFRESNEVVFRKGRANPEFEGMGTTATALVLHDDGALIAHVGDSRAYRIRDGVIEQLSADHSLAWEIARARGLSDSEAGQMVPKNVITRSLGPEQTVQVDIEGPYPVQEGDIFVLCSDGLSGTVSEHEIAILAATLPPEEAADRLVDLANLRGGTDNITVVIVHAKRKLGQQRRSLTRRLKDALVRWALSYVLEPTSLRRGGELAMIGGLLGILGGVAFRWFTNVDEWHIPLISGLLLGVVGAVAFFGARAAERVVRSRTRVFHQEPYRRYHFQLSCEALAPWRSWLEEIYDVAVEHSWPVAWEEFCAAKREFVEAITGGPQGDGDGERRDRFERAVRAFATCVRVLAEAQKQRRKQELAR